MRRGAPRIPLLAMNRGPGSALNRYSEGVGEAFDSRRSKNSGIRSGASPICIRFGKRGGKVIPFRPRPQQSQVLDMLFRRGLKRIVILKARQIGFSTLFGGICADQLCWNTGKQVSLVDKTQEDARQKLKTSPCSPTTRCIRSLRIASW